MSIRTLSEEEELEIAVDIISYKHTSREIAKRFDITETRARAAAIRKFKQMLPKLHKEMEEKCRYLGLHLYRRFGHAFRKEVSVRFIEKARDAVFLEAIITKELDKAFDVIKKIIRESSLQVGPEYYI